MLDLVIKFRIFIYEITIHHLINVTLLLRHIEFVVDGARPASSPSTRSRRRPASEDPCSDWAPPGWHWEVLPSGARRLVRNPNPHLLWWRSRGPLLVRREPALPEVVRHRVREEDEHVNHYMADMDVRFSNTWQVLWGDHPSYDPVMVPSLWVSTARTSGTMSDLDYSVVFDLY